VIELFVRWIVYRNCDLDLLEVFHLKLRYIVLNRSAVFISFYQLLSRTIFKVFICVHSIIYRVCFFLKNAFISILRAVLNDVYCCKLLSLYLITISLFDLFLSFNYFLFSSLSIDVLSVFYALCHELLQRFSILRTELHNVFEMRPVILIDRALQNLW